VFTSEGYNLLPNDLVVVQPGKNKNLELQTPIFSFSLFLTCDYHIGTSSLNIQPQIINQGSVDPIILKDRFAQSIEPAGISLKSSSLLNQNWYWFAIFGFVGIFGGYTYNKILLPYYRISTTVLVLDDQKRMT